MVGRARRAPPESNRYGGEKNCAFSSLFGPGAPPPPEYTRPSAISTAEAW